MVVVVVVLVVVVKQRGEREYQYQMNKWQFFRKIVALSVCPCIYILISAIITSILNLLRRYVECECNRIEKMPSFSLAPITFAMAYRQYIATMLILII